MRQSAAFLLASLAAGMAWSAPCGGVLDARTRREIASDSWVLAYAPSPAPIAAGRHFRLDIVVCGAPVEALRVQADMPAHGHGMNYRTTVSDLGDGRFRAQGLLFHMPGRWRLLFDLDTGAGTVRLTQEVNVP